MENILENLTSINPSKPETWPLWLNAEEVCAVLRLSLSTVRSLHLCGKLRGRKFGKRVRWHRDSVTQFVS